MLDGTALDHVGAVPIRTKTPIRRSAEIYVFGTCNCKNATDSRSQDNNHHISARRRRRNHLFGSDVSLPISMLRSMAAALCLSAYPGIIWGPCSGLPYESHRLQAFG